MQTNPLLQCLKPLAYRHLELKETFVKLLTLLFLILTAASGKAWGFGMPAISVGQDSELLTDTPIPIPHLTATPTKTATPLPTFTPTPTATKPMTLPTTTETITLLPVNPPASPADRLRPDHSLTLDPSLSGLNSFREEGFFEVGLGVDPLIQGSTMSGTATGAKTALGIMFKDGFVVQLDLETFSQSNTNPTGTLTENEVLVLPTLRRYLSAGNVRPYLSISNGLAINTITSGLTSSSVDSFDMALGGGFEFVFENYFCTYVEGKYNFVFMSASPSQDIPLAVGARLGL
jgi:hypothetical protein